MRKLDNAELGRLSADAFRQSEKTPLILVLDDVRSGHNIGSVFRTADAFRIDSVYLCGITATPPNKEIGKTALGADETVDWKHFPSVGDAISQLLGSGVEVIAVEQAEGATMLQDFRPEPGKKYAFVFGNEVFGVSQQAIDQCGKCLEIPQTGTKHSLNISVSVGVVVWDYFNKIHFANPG